MRITSLEKFFNYIIKLKEVKGCALPHRTFSIAHSTASISSLEAGIVIAGLCKKDDQISAAGGKCNDRR
ncbi:MAG: hypothetical protein TV41_07275 [Wolbachia endosymbiont of Dactylopius coccus]|nr:MAG: hypothetical protein TV41_07275 [Wolbachia endosymbiont of Dactylopius coccus]